MQISVKEKAGTDNADADDAMTDSADTDNLLWLGYCPVFH